MIVPGHGLRPPETVFSPEQLRATAHIDVDEDNPVHHDALLAAAASLDRATGHQCSFVLLGSVASAKYTTALLKVLDHRLLFPAEFVGRGDMSRGGHYAAQRSVPPGADLYTCQRCATSRTAASAAGSKAANEGLPVAPSHLPAIHGIPI